VTRRTMPFLAIALACSLSLVAGCGSDGDDKGSSTTTTTGSKTTSAVSAGLPQDGEPVKLDPADFTTKIDNPYWPMPKGARWVYLSDKERIVVEVTNRRKKIEGVDAVVLRDTVYERGGGAFVEVTDDWYSQDKKGNVWYLGEDTKEYKDRKVSSTKGSWEHGVDGAYAGIIMPAKPRPGMVYRQEYYKGEAEDAAKVVSVDAKVTVPFGTFQNCVKTEETTALEPGTLELKYYAKGIGHVLRTGKDGGGREELVSYKR
jgi:hypothetical protein